MCCQDQPKSFLLSSRLVAFIFLSGIVFFLFVFKSHILSREGSGPMRVHEPTCPSYWKRRPPKCCDGHRSFSVDYTHNSTDCVKLHFADTDNYLPATALASFPGSGNHWLRHLVQQTTGNTDIIHQTIGNSDTTQQTTCNSDTTQQTTGNSDTTQQTTGNADTIHRLHVILVQSYRLKVMLI